MVRQANPQARTVVITGHRAEMDQHRPAAWWPKGPTPSATSRSTCRACWPRLKQLTKPSSRRSGVGGTGYAALPGRARCRRILICACWWSTTTPTRGATCATSWNWTTTRSRRPARSPRCLQRKDWAAISAILLDRRLPDGTAEELLPRLRQLAPEAAILIVTGYADLQGAIAALRQGAADYILKPINPDALRASLARIAERRRLALAKERSEAAFRTLVEAAPCLIVILRADHTHRLLQPVRRGADRLPGRRGARARTTWRTFCAERLSADGRANSLRQVLAGTPARGFESPVLCRDGSQRWIVWNAQLLARLRGRARRS